MSIHGHVGLSVIIHQYSCTKSRQDFDLQPSLLKYVFTPLRRNEQMATTPHIKIAKCTDDDIPECFAVMSHGFGHDAPFLDAYFPDHDTPEGSKTGTARLLAWKQGEPESTFLKATLGDKIIGIAVWSYIKEAPSADLTQYENVQAVWPNEDDLEHMMQMWSSYVISRANAIKEGGSSGIYGKQSN